MAIEPQRQLSDEEQLIQMGQKLQEDLMAFRERLEPYCTKKSLIQGNFSAFNAPLFESHRLISLVCNLLAAHFFLKTRRDD
jgi:hypothetical protein